jgi:ferric-dicitrate binding protein FerR (iron transport regulator)
MVAEERGRRFRRRATYAIAASLLIMLLGSWYWLASIGPSAPGSVATVELSTGSAVVGDTLGEGALLEPSGLVALRMARGQSVRIDEGSSLRLISDSRMELERGAVYIDSGPSIPAGATIEVQTAFGVVREIGTQFEVRLSEGAESLRVSVREGGITIAHDGSSQSVSGGERLTLNRDGEAMLDAIAPDSPAWFWVQEAAPAIEIEGRSLASYLGWVARETGWRIHYADDELARAVDSIMLHGTIEGLRPGESLGVILEGSGLIYLEEDGSILISRP